MTDKIIENWSIAQKAGAWLPCPRCGKLTMKEDLYSNAFSRRADIYICDSCGTQEAIEDVPYIVLGNPSCRKKTSLGDWFVVQSVYRKPGIVRKGDDFLVVAEQKITLTKQDIDDIMVGALEGGINYWCRKAEVVGAYLGDYASEQIARDGVLMLHDSDEDKVYELTLEKFLNGFKLWVADGGGQCGAICDGEVDCCNIDAGDADSIIQYSLFGDIVFG